MKLELTDIEKEKLMYVLENFIPELRGEIASGVKHDWKMELKKEEAILQGVMDKMKKLHDTPVHA